MNAPTRRGLLAGVAALAPVTSAVSLAVLPAAPDAVLIALCATFHAIHDEAEAITTDEGLTAAQDRRRDVQHQIQPIVPVTAAGRAAKAKVAMHRLRPDHPGGDRRRRTAGRGRGRWQEADQAGCSSGRRAARRLRGCRCGAEKTGRPLYRPDAGGG